MSDFDFDEIDRAVSSTMSPSKDAPEPPADDSKVAVSVTRTSTPTVPRPTSGRFMDVVHPSSDMKGSEKPAPQPEVKTPEPVIDTSADNVAWPDPLDFHGFKDDEPVAEEKTPDEDELTLPETPFLAGTKVEKRPLGAFSTAEPATPLLEDPTEDEPLLEATNEPEVEEVPNPEEPVETVTETLEEEVATPPAPAVEDEYANVPTSITQQYKEQPATDDNPSGAIFDTESYHAPLTHTPKKSGALVILWIVALILVGGGIGAAAYFFVLPNL